MTLDTAITLCAFVLVLIVPTYLLLEVRAVRRGLQQLHQRQRQHAGAIIQLQTTVADTPLQVHQPMPTVGRAKATPAAVPAGWASLTAATPDRPTRATTGDIDHDPDETLPLGPAPSLANIADRCQAAGLNPTREALARIASIEQHLAAGRPATRMELARSLGLQPWEISVDLHNAVQARIVTTTSGNHTAGEAAYTLADPTTRMASMPILRGAR